MKTIGAVHVTHGELTSFRPATKEVPSMEKGELELDSRFVTMCPITTSTVSIKLLTTGPDC